MVDPTLRNQVLHQALQALREDIRVTGVVHIGSGVDGYIDALSDIDLLAVIHDEADVEPAHADWVGTVRRLFPVLHHARSPFTEANHLHIFILDELLELDTSFVACASLQPRWDRGRVIFDRTGEVRKRLAHAAPLATRRDDHRVLFDQACHRVLECRKALYRDKLWQAALVLDELRSITVQVAGRVHIESDRQRDVDHLPHPVLVMLDLAEQLYVRAGSTFPHPFAAALRAAVRQGTSSSEHEP